MSVLVAEWIEQPISLKNKHGLHRRPAQRIVETADGFDCEVRVIKDKLNMNAKSLLDMIEFAEYMVNRAETDDNEFAFRARGPEAEKALQALLHLVDDRFGLE